MILVKELVIRNTFTRFLLMISVWTGLNPLKEDDRDGLRLPQEEDLEDDDEKDEVEDDKDPSDIVQCFR